MVSHIVRVRSHTYSVLTEKRGETSFMAIGEFQGEKIRTVATSERTALSRWGEAALLRLDPKDY
jgi:hypothetical protein